MNITELEELRDRIRVFRDREDAGRVLAKMVGGCEQTVDTVLAIPAGGVPVAAEIVKNLKSSLGVAVVSKVTPIWNTEVGYGAVAFDGRVRINQEMVRHLGVDQEQMARDIERTRAKVQRRLSLFGAADSLLPLRGRSLMLVDDGLASGFTMHVAIESLREAGTARVVVAVPTGHIEALKRIAAQADQVFCANVRRRLRFAVADAYEHWSDVTEEQAGTILKRGRNRGARG